MSIKKRPLYLIIGEGALEVVPTEILKEPSVLKQADSRRKPAEQMILDRSYHHRAMLSLPDSDKRGRPDLVHVALLESTSTPLYMHDFLKVIVDCYDGPSIHLGENVRVPRSYSRFLGLIEKLLSEKRVGFNNKDLLNVREGGMKAIISDIKPTKIIGMSRLGKTRSVKDVANLLSKEERPALVVGGFPRGQFSKETVEELDETFSLGNEGLDAHIVIGRILYEYENLVLGN